MAREVIVRFGTTNLERGKEAVAQMLRDARAAAKLIADPQARREFLTEARAQGRSRREELERTARFDALSRAARDKRAANLGELGPLIDRAVARQVSNIRKGIERAEQIGNAASALLSGTADPNKANGLQLALKGAEAIRIPIVSDFAALLSRLVEFLDERDATLRDRLDKLVLARLEERLAEADTQKRYKEDVRFRARIDAQAREQYLSDVESGWQPRGSRLADGDL